MNYRLKVRFSIARSSNIFVSLEFISLTIFQTNHGKDNENCYMFACSGMQILMKLKISYQGCDTYQYFPDTLDLINKETSLLHMYLYGIEK